MKGDFLRDINSTDSIPVSHREVLIVDVEAILASDRRFVLVHPCRQGSLSTVSDTMVDHRLTVTKVNRDVRVVK